LSNGLSTTLSLIVGEYTVIQRQRPVERLKGSRAQFI
jgi:hypothetical protein